MSLTNYPHSATPEEVDAYKLGKHDALIQIRRMAHQIHAYEQALSRIKRSATHNEAITISTRTLSTYQGKGDEA